MMTGSPRMLVRPPGRGALYRDALLSTLRRRGPRDTVPDAELTRSGVTVQPDHLAAYDRVCGFRLSDTLPVTYPHVLAFPLAVALMGRADFPLPLVGLVHVANRIELHRPVRLGDRLDLRVYADDLRPHDRGRQVDLVAETRIGDETVWLSRSTYLHRDAATKPERQTVHDGPPAATATWQATANWQVPARVGKDYAEVSGDRNPIHTSRLGARLFGFPRPIAHGMWSKARCLAALEGRLPDAYAVDVAFKSPILLPATVAFRAEHDNGRWQLALAGATSGRPHLTGAVTTL
jgi:acyl dehydratase